MIDNIVTKEIAVSNKVSFVKKILNILWGIKVLKKIRPLYIFLPKMSAYTRGFDKTKCIPFLIKDEHFLEKYNGRMENSQQH